MWIDGLGEVLAQNGDERLAMRPTRSSSPPLGVLDELDLDTALRTGVVRSGDDLVLVAESDPTLTSKNTALARRVAMLVRAAGITEVAAIS